jgi:hypothetical protein
MSRSSMSSTAAPRACSDGGRAGAWDLGSAIRSVTDVDRPAVRVAFFSPSAIEGFLKQNLRHATVIETPSIAHGVRRIELGQAEG